jgi:hypothetical protein
MSSKSTIIIFMIIGSTIGGLIPTLWGAGLFDVSSMFFTAIGGGVGIWLGYKFSE